MVRTAPNELSFSSAASWRDIHGFRQGHKPFIKSPFYDGGSFADQAHSIVSERDPVTHGQMRKHLSHAFSDRSLKDQESLVAEVVDLFIKQLGVHASGKDGADMVMWFNLTTFDIIGSLAFGESFGGLQSGVCGPERPRRLWSVVAPLTVPRKLSFLDQARDQRAETRRTRRHHDAFSMGRKRFQALDAKGY